MLNIFDMEPKDDEEWVEYSLNNMSVKLLPSADMDCKECMGGDRNILSFKQVTEFEVTKVELKGEQVRITMEYDIVLHRLDYALIDIHGKSNDERVNRKIKCRRISNNVGIITSDEIDIHERQIVHDIRFDNMPQIVGTQPYVQDRNIMHGIDVSGSIPGSSEFSIGSISTIAVTPTRPLNANFPGELRGSHHISNVFDEITEDANE